MNSGNLPTQKKVISLGEIPEEGQSFVFSRKTGELNEDLNDLLSDHDYSYEFFIKPLGNAYEVTGHFTTSLTLICSRSAEEFVHPIAEKVHELLIVSEPLGRTGKSPKTPFSQLEESGPFCTELESESFDFGSFARELTVTAEPNNPIDPNMGGESYLEKHNREMEDKWQKATQMDPKASKNPFNVLKKWKQ